MHIQYDPRAMESKRRRYERSLVQLPKSPAITPLWVWVWLIAANLSGWTTYLLTAV